MIQLPSPHPLDFDWRYDEATALRLANMVRNIGPVIAYGVPSVARLLEKANVAVTLVDRQPLQGVQSHISCSVEDFVAVSDFRTAIADPPWYPQQLNFWSCSAGRAVGIGGTILLSVWPSDTRPGAEYELTKALVDMSSWATIERGVESLHYIQPKFEVAAQSHGANLQLSRSPLYGELVRLKVFRRPEVCIKPNAQATWLRFTVDDYQLALRLNPTTTSKVISSVHGVKDWRWPYVSARAPSREQIGLWSSAGEVAAVGSPEIVAATLRAAFSSSGDSDFEKSLSLLPPLLSWSIPRPPYQRSIEWQHHQ